MGDFEVREPSEPRPQGQVVLAPVVPAGQVTIRLLGLYLMIAASMGVFFWFTHERESVGDLYWWAGLGAAWATVQGTAVILRNGRGGQD
jgi:hypothetical protein